MHHFSNARLNEAQAGIKIVSRNINNLSYADDTTLMAESERSYSKFKVRRGSSEEISLRGIPKVRSSGCALLEQP